MMAADPGFNPSSMVLPHDVKAMAFTCIGYHEVMHGTGVTGLGLTLFPDPHGKSGQRSGNETNLPRIGFCLPVVLS